MDEFLVHAPVTGLFELKGYPHEIGTTSTVLDHQRVLLGELEARIRDYHDYHSRLPELTGFAEQNMAVYMYLKDLGRIDRMDRQAVRLYEFTANLLDLKQKHVNQFEARMEREQATKQHARAKPS
ncbi:hypothetical protein BDW68DRAFT_159822 [Aspergillus falconensis]